VFLNKKTQIFDTPPFRVQTGMARIITQGVAIGLGNWGLSAHSLKP